MNEAAYTEDEKRCAKQLKRLVREETQATLTHTHCLRLVRKHKDGRYGKKREEFAAFVAEAEGLLSK